MNNPKTATNQPFLRRLTLLALPALVAAAMGCGPEEQLPEPLAEAKHEVRAPSETMTPALRAAYVANVQSNASRDYALKQNGGVLKAHNAAQRFDVEMGEAVSVRLPGDERLSFDLAGVGCDGELRGVGKAAPAAAGNRVEYVRRGGEADDLTEWYVHGPLGLEQGFTLGRPLDCGTREVVIDVGMGGSLVPSVAAQGKAVLLRNPVGRAVARYSDLYVVDAAGRELPSKLEVVGGSVRIRFDERAAVYPVRVDPLVAVEQAKLFPSDGGDLWGWFVGISNETVIVGGGSSFPDVFVGNENFWTLQGTLEPNDGANAGPAAISGDTAVVGAPGSHAAYVFTRAAGMWTERAKIESSDGIMQDFFGGHLAISGGTVVVGAEYDDDKGTDAGAAYIFEGGGDVWIQQAKILASDGEGKDPATGDFIADSFGSAVAVGGDTAVVGAPTHVALGTQGAAYVFDRAGTDWIERAQLLPDNIEDLALFGTSVAISGGRILVGAPGTNAAYVFVGDGENWVQEAKLVPDGGSGEEFGFAVALDGDIAVVGDRDGGRTHLFARIGGQWTKEAVLAHSGNDLFGTSVALSGNNMVVGAPGDNAAAGSTVGAAYAYTIGSQNGTPCSTSSECASTYCVDGFCCDSQCDAGLCDACAVVAGAFADGICTLLSGNACDDESLCTLSDACDNGVCEGAPVSCLATDSCHDDGVCDPTSGLCENEAKTDGALCPLGVCQDGACQPADKPNGPPRVVGGDCGCTLLPRSRGSSCAVLTLAIVAMFVERRRLRGRRKGEPSLRLLRRKRAKS